jgi:hypothetical protein
MGEDTELHISKSTPRKTAILMMDRSTEKGIQLDLHNETVLDLVEWNAPGAGPIPDMHQTLQGLHLDVRRICTWMESRLSREAEFILCFSPKGKTRPWARIMGPMINMHVSFDLRTFAGMAKEIKFKSCPDC